MMVLMKTACNDSIIQNIVRCNTIFDHPLIEVDGHSYLANLHTRLDQAGVYEDSRFHICFAHVFKDSDDTIEVAHLLVDFGQDRISNITSPDLQLFHILIALERHLCLIGLKTPIQK